VQSIHPSFPRPTPPPSSVLGRISDVISLLMQLAATAGLLPRSYVAATGDVDRRRREK